MKETQRAAERIIHEIVPNLSQLLERPVLTNHELSEYYYARQVLEQVEIEFRTLKKSHQILQERNNEISMQMDVMKGELTRQAQSTIENCSPNAQMAHQLGNLAVKQASSASDYRQGSSGYRLAPPGQQRSSFDVKLSEARAQEH